MFIRSPYNYDTDIVSHKSGLDCSDSPSLAQQHMRDECDINIMVARFAKTGIPDAPPVIPSVVDFDEIFDFQSAMNVIVDGRKAFAGLPSRIRARFDNDPGQFLAFVHDSSNRDEAVSLGLVSRETVVSQTRDTSDVTSSDTSIVVNE